MSNIILSVKPKFARMILLGQKTVEIRKRIPTTQYIHKVFLYSTYPQKEIFGWFCVDKILNNNIDKLWTQTKDHCCLEKDDFFRYFLGHERGFAIFFDSFMKFITPFCFTEIKRVEYNFVPPQSYCYISDQIYKRLALRKTIEVNR